MHSHPFNYHACTAGRIWKRICPCLNNSFFSLSLLLSFNGWKIIRPILETIVSASSSTKVNLWLLSWQNISKVIAITRTDLSGVLCLYLRMQQESWRGRRIFKEGVSEKCVFPQMHEREHRHKPKANVTTHQYLHQAPSSQWLYQCTSILAPKLLFLLGFGKRIW